MFRVGDPLSRSGWVRKRLLGSGVVGLVLLLVLASSLVALGALASSGGATNHGSRAPLPGSGSDGGLRTAACPCAVTFTESGLPSGTTWSVTISGVTQTAVAPASVVFPMEPNGRHVFTVPTIMISAFTGFYGSPAIGNFTLAGASPPPIAITFLHAWLITLKEVGFPIGTTWTLGVNSTNPAVTNTTETTNTVSFPLFLPNGTYNFHPENPVPGVAGVQYIENASQPAVIFLTVAGVSANRTIHYHPQYFLTTASAPGAGGSVSPLSGWFNNSTAVPVTATAAAGFAFASWTGAGSGSYTGTNNPTSLTMNGPITETANFATAYTVTFSESGLPAATMWTVTLNGVALSSTTTTITFSEVNGTYPYSVTPIPGYRASSYGGSVTVAGTNPTISIAWTAFTYTVTFTETGLPSGTSWSITLNGVPQGSTTTTIAFPEPNGTWAYTVGVVPGYHTATYAGTVHVIGADTGVTVSWSVFSWTVSFTETGLPTGTGWSVTLSGTTMPGTAPGPISFSEPNGSYSFTVSAVSGFLVKPTSGSLSVSGAPVSTPITFSKLYTVFVVESGLPSATPWSVSYNGTPFSATTATIAFSEPNGSYTLTVSAIPGYHANAYNVVATVSGADATVTVSWILFTYTVTFTTMGLPTGTVWSVNLAGVVLSSGSALIVFQKANGSYAFTIGAVSGYSMSPANGSAPVNGAAVTEIIQFTATGTSFLSGTGLYVLIGGVVVLAAVLTTLAILLSRRRKKPTVVMTPTA